MILLVSGATATLRGLPSDAPVGHLVTPHTGNQIARIAIGNRPWGADNGCGPKPDGTPGRLDEAAYWSMLDRIRQASISAIKSGAPNAHPLFVVVPDSVGDARETLQMWRHYHGRVRALLFRPRLAFVAQDGSEAHGMIPWGEFRVLFIGGSTDWKEGGAARALVIRARAAGVRVHVGRVNSERRLRLFDDLGYDDDGYPMAVDSLDGTQFSMYPDAYIPRWTERLRPSFRSRVSNSVATLPMFDEGVAG